MSAAATHRIHIFRAGRHVDGNGHDLEFTVEDLQRMCRAYNPQAHTAPLVLGHPKTDDPALGRVLSMSVEGENLYAQAEVDEQLRDLVRQGKYLRVSAALYRPQDVSNPSPGGWYLRHVGFLGAMPPAIKGLQPPAFAEGDMQQAVFAQSIALGDVDFSQFVYGADSAQRAHFHDVASRFAAASGVSYAQAVAEMSGRHNTAFLRLGADGLARQKGRAGAGRAAFADGAPCSDREALHQQIAAFADREAISYAQAHEELHTRHYRASATAAARAEAVRFAEAQSPQGRQAHQQRRQALHQRILKYQSEHPGTSYAQAYQAVARHH